MGAVTNTNCYLNVKLNRVRKWIIETQILAAGKKVCRGGSVAAQVEQLFPKWDLGTPRRCPGGGLWKLGIVWKEIPLTGKFSHWELHGRRCIATNVHYFWSMKLLLILYSHHRNIRMTHTSSVVRENIQHAQDAEWKRHHILCCTRHSAA